MCTMLVSYFGNMSEKEIVQQRKQIFAVNGFGEGDDVEDDVGGDDDDDGGHLVGKGEVWVEDVAHS